MRSRLGFVKWLLTLIIVSGCANYASRMADLKIGMTKDQVKQVLGKPDSVAAKNPDIVVFVYALRPDRDSLFLMDYWVRFEGGLVVQYGRAGDWTDRTQKYHLTIKKKEPLEAPTPH